MGGKGKRGRAALSGAKAAPARAKTTSSLAGRPPIVSEEALLHDALRLFAEFGYEGMSVRLLNQQLGISHNTVNKRYGSKLGLWHAAIDYGFQLLRNDVMAILIQLGSAGEPKVVARAAIAAFLRASQNRPEMMRLMTYEGANQSERLNYIFNKHMQPLLALVDLALQRAIDAGQARPISLRAITFLMAHGAAAPFSLRALSKAYDPLTGPLDEDGHIENMADFLIAGIFRD